MPTACSVKGCKRLWKKHSQITFHRFPCQNKQYLKYWIAATGNDLVAYSNARICSLSMNIYESEDEYPRGSIPPNSVMKTLNEYIMYYLSGYIVKTLRLKCYTCGLSLRKPDHELNYANSETFTKVLDFLNNGGLIRPSISVYKICMEMEKQLNIVTDGYTELFVEQLDVIVINRVKSILALDSSIFPNLECENDTVPHKISLIIAISSRYADVRLYSYSKFYYQQILKPIRKRHKLTKQILFSKE